MDEQGRVGEVFKILWIHYCGRS